MAALFIGPEQVAQLNALRERAAAAPVDMKTLGARLTTTEGNAAHRAQMTAQSVMLPVSLCVTFSIEIGHPAGTARHVSISLGSGKLPDIYAAWMICTELGFVGDYSSCALWPEDLEQGRAINIVQLVQVEAEARA